MELSPLVLHQWTGLSHTEFKFSKIGAQSVSFFHIFFSSKNRIMEFNNRTDWAPISLRLKFWGISRFTSLWRFVRIPGIAWSTSWEPKSSHFRGDYSLITPSKILTALSIPPTSQDNLTSLIWPSNLGYRHLVHYVVEFIDCCLNLKSPPFSSSLIECLVHQPI